MIEPVRLELHAKQSLALSTDATETLFGGAAGGGKSHLMRAAALKWGMDIPGLQVYLFRRIRKDLISNHMEGVTGFPTLLSRLVNAGQARIVKDEIRLPNQSKIHLEYCQHERDVVKYDGYEMHVILVDELTHWTEYMYRYLRGRSRMNENMKQRVPEPLAGCFPRILCGTNPGGLGHHWVKETFRPDMPFVLRKQPKKEGGKLRQFIPSRLEDNPSLDREEYTATLSGLGDPALVRAKLDGDWDVVAGSMFGDVWRNALHTCDAFAIPKGWKLWRGGDDGFAAPSAIYWLTQDPDTKTIYVIDELYRAGMLPELSAERTLEKDAKIQMLGAYAARDHNREMLSGIMDSAAFVSNDGKSDRQGQKVESRGDQMNRMGCNWKPASKPPGSRVQRVQNFHRLLARNKQDWRARPGIIFFRNCKDAIRTIPTLPRDPHNPDDVDTDAEDHAFDGVTYGLQWVSSGGGMVRVGT